MLEKQLSVFLELGNPSSTCGLLRAEQRGGEPQHSRAHCWPLLSAGCRRKHQQTAKARLLLLSLRRYTVPEQAELILAQPCTPLGYLVSQL